MDLLNSDIQISRSGYYTVTFENTSCMSEKEIRNELSSVGEVCAVIWKRTRVFIRFKHKEEAQKALIKYGKILKLRMAFNSNPSYKPPPSVGEDDDDNDNDNDDDNDDDGDNDNDNDNDDDEEEEEEEENLKELNNKILSVPKFSESNIDSENNNLNHEDKNFCLILSNLPKKYLFKDVRALVEETKPLWVELDETKIFNVRFAYVIVDSLDKIAYLIEKLNGFVICGEELEAVEAHKLLNWRYNEGEIAV